MLEFTYNQKLTLLIYVMYAIIRPTSGKEMRRTAWVRAVRQNATSWWNPIAYIPDAGYWLMWTLAEWALVAGFGSIWWRDSTHEFFIPIAAVTLVHLFAIHVFPSIIVDDVQNSFIVTNLLVVLDAWICVGAAVALVAMQGVEGEAVLVVPYAYVLLVDVIGLWFTHTAVFSLWDYTYSEKSYQKLMEVSGSY